MKFTVYKNKKVLGVIEAKDLEEANKLGTKQYPDWTEIYIGKKKDWENGGKGYGNG